MSEIVNRLPVVGEQRTNRKDRWWELPTLQGAALVIVMIWTFIRVILWDDSIAFQDHRVTSPLFSPDVLHWLDITNHPGWLNGAMLILWIPFGFRGTCYYMRRVYYRSFFQSPTACWVDEPQLNTRIGYTFEKGPFIINNLHRYFLYAAMAVLLVKWFEVLVSMRFTDEVAALYGRNSGIGVSVGTLVLAIESFLLTMYVTSCHATRHLAGGVLDRWVSGVAALRGRVFHRLTALNRQHGFYFWVSLCMVFVGDAYVIIIDQAGINDPAFILSGRAST